MTAATPIPNDTDKVQFIQQTVAEYFNLPIPKMIAVDRHPHVAWPRQIAMSLSCEFAGASLYVVGLKFKRTHGTVIHAKRRVRDMYDTEPNTRRLIDTMKQVIMERFSE